MISLRDGVPLASGHLRDVYAHPDAPDLLIKVMRASDPANAAAVGGWFRARAQLGQYRPYLREFKEYLATRVRATAERPVPLSRIVGLAETDVGLGLVVEKVRAPDGSLAPTLNQWSRAAGYTAQVRQTMAQFYGSLLHYGVIASDLHERNVVYGSDSQGGPRLVMIDGFGEKNLIPLRSISSANNRRRTRLKFERMRRGIEQAAQAEAAKEHDAATADAQRVESDGRHAAG